MKPTSDQRRFAKWARQKHRHWTDRLCLLYWRYWYRLHPEGLVDGWEGYDG